MTQTGDAGPNDGGGAIGAAADGGADGGLSCHGLAGNVLTDDCECTAGQPAGSLTSCPSVAVPSTCTQYVRGSTAGCSCTPNCVSQKGVGPSGSTYCSCGYPPRYPGGEGVRIEAQARCALTLCCRGGGTCDCSDDPAFRCAQGTQKVDACSPDDFPASAYRERTFLKDLYSNVTPVDRCL